MNGGNGNVKVPPHSREYEAAVLGGVMCDDVVLSEVDFLSPQDFYDLDHSLIYRAMQKLHSSGEKVDLLTVSEALRQDGKLMKAGGAFYISGLSESCPSAYTAPTYAKKVWENSQGRKIQELGYRLAQGDVEEKVRAHTKLIEMDFIPPWEKDQKLIKVKTFEALVNDTTQAPEHLISRGLLPAQSILLLTGAPKTGKSILALNLALCLAAGEDWFQFEIRRQVKILMIQAEVVHWALRGRLQKMKLGCNFPIPENSLFLSEPYRCNVRSEEGYKVITETIDKTKPEVVIFDPLISFHNEDENSNDCMERVLMQFRELTFLGVSVILIHHSRKFSDDSTISNPRGASAIAGAVDSVMDLSKRESIITAKFDLRYDETPDEMFFKRDPETLWLMRYSPELEAKHNNAILRHLTGKGSEGIPLIDLVNELLKEFDKSDRTVRRYISDLSKTGIITITGKGPSKRVVLKCNLN